MKRLSTTSRTYGETCPSNTSTDFVHFEPCGEFGMGLKVYEPFFMLDARPLRHLVDNAFPNLAFRTSIDSGLCKAFYISATDLASGFNTLFVDTKDNGRLNVGGPNIHVASVKVKDGSLLSQCGASAPLQPVGGRWPPVCGWWVTPKIHPLDL